jgi:hypothetical protein
LGNSLREIEREQDRSSVVQVTKIKGDLVSEAIVPLQQVAESLCTRQDIAAAHHATKISLRAERALRRLFTLSAQSGVSYSFLILSVVNYFISQPKFTDQRQLADLD